MLYLFESSAVHLRKSHDRCGHSHCLRKARRQKSGQQASSQTIEFILCDRGAGLSEAALSHLFEAFFSTKTEGLGIGLNLCRSIVESHHGRLRAENLYNEDGTDICGCCFSFWLPVHAA